MRNQEEEQRTIRKSGRNTPEGRIRADFPTTDGDKKAVDFSKQLAEPHSENTEVKYE